VDDPYKRQSPFYKGLCRSLAEREGFEPAAASLSIKTLEWEYRKPVPYDHHKSPYLPLDLPLERTSVPRNYWGRAFRLRFSSYRLDLCRCRCEKILVMQPGQDRFSKHEYTRRQLMSGI